MTAVSSQQGQRGRGGRGLGSAKLRSLGAGPFAGQQRNFHAGMAAEAASARMRAAEQSSSSGMLVSDLLQLRDGGVEVVFGCETKETGEIFNQEADGILGLGNSEVSLVNQVRPGTFCLFWCILSADIYRAAAGDFPEFQLRAGQVATSFSAQRWLWC